MMFVVLFLKRHVQLHSDFRNELPEIGSRFQRERVQEKFNNVELITPVQLAQELSRRLLIYGRIETYAKYLLRIPITRAVQLELLTVEANHRFVNRELIR